MQDCIYKDVCSLFNSQECNNACIRYLEMSNLLNSSNLPKKLKAPVKLLADSCDIEAFTKLAKIKSNIENLVVQGTNIYIYSQNCGNGKTSWAVKLLLKYFDCIWNGNGFRQRGLFIHVPSLLLNSKIFDQKVISDELTNLKQLCYSVDLVVWDDIATNEASAYEQNILISLLDYRQNNGLANIFTSNISPEQLEGVAGKRLSSRLCRGIKINIKGKDKRNGNIADIE